MEKPESPFYREETIDSLETAIKDVSRFGAKATLYQVIRYLKKSKSPTEMWYLYLSLPTPEDEQYFAENLIDEFFNKKRIISERNPSRTYSYYPGQTNPIESLGETQWAIEAYGFDETINDVIGYLMQGRNPFEMLAVFDILRTPKDQNLFIDQLLAEFYNHKEWNYNLEYNQYRQRIAQISTPKRNVDDASILNRLVQEKDFDALIRFLRGRPDRTNKIKSDDRHLILESLIFEVVRHLPPPPQVLQKAA